MPTAFAASDGTGKEKRLKITALETLRLGEFPKRAPNGKPDAGDPLYGYVQVGFQI